MIYRTLRPSPEAGEMKITGCMTTTFANQDLLRKLAAQVAPSMVNGEIEMDASFVDFDALYTFQSNLGGDLYQWVDVKPERGRDGRAIFKLGAGTKISSIAGITPSMIIADEFVYID